MNDKLRLHYDLTGWAVLDDSEEPNDSNNFGVLAAGFPDEAEAKEWLDEWRAHQCSKGEWHTFGEEDGDEGPF